MKTDVTPFTRFPPDWRRQTVTRILEAANRGENLQLIGLPGSGRTVILSSLISSPQVLKHHLQENQKNFRFVYLNFGLVPEKSPVSLLAFLLTHLLQDAKPEIDPHRLIISLDRIIRQLVSENRKLIFILDSFDHLDGLKLDQFFQTLRGWRDFKRDQIVFVFVVDREITRPEQLKSFGQLAPLLVENLYYLPPLTPKESRWFLSQQESLAGRKFNRSQQEKMIKLSGGFMRTLKRLAQALNSGQKLADLQKNPEINVHLDYHCQQLLEALQPEENTLKNLITGRLIESDQPHLNRLRQLHLIDRQNRPRHPLFFTFLEKRFSRLPEHPEVLTGRIKLEKNLTANEFRAFRCLSDYRDQICSRDRLISGVWGKNASTETADHALDQLIHRLRDKLKSAQPPLKLETVRGRGHRLSSD
jgi:hypothetical protein